MSGKYVTPRRPASSAPPRQTVASGRNSDDPILRWLLVVCVISALADIYIHSSMQYGLEQQEQSQPAGNGINVWRPNRRNMMHNHHAATPDNAKEISTENTARIPPANQVPSVLPPMDMGNDESNRIKMSLRRAGVIVSDALEAELPAWSEMTSMYGSQPVIIGLDRCEEFRRARSKPNYAMIGPVGMFNTGAKYLWQMLYLNCKIPDSKMPSNGMRRSVPWGKHAPASYRLKFDAKDGGGVSHIDTLPVVVVKDPFSWMSSMCNHPNAASWRHTRVHCPNLVANPDDEMAGIHGMGADKSIGVTIKYHEDNHTHHESLAGLWNDWYREYYEAPWPRLIVRHEDLLFYPEFVVTKACQCAGGKIMYENIMFADNSAKGENSFPPSIYDTKPHH